MPMRKIKRDDEFGLHFLTFTTIEWIDVFTKPVYFQLLAESVKYCQDNFGLRVYGYVFMTNHTHFLWQADGEKPDYPLSKIAQSYKRFTTEKIKGLLNKESRKYIAGLIKTSFNTKLQ